MSEPNWKERAEKAEAWLERLRTDPECVWANMLRGEIARPQAMDHYEQCKTELEQAQAACAEMRSVIASIRYVDNYVQLPSSFAKDHALGLECGKGFLSPEKAKELESRIAFRDRCVQQAGFDIDKLESKIKLLIGALEDTRKYDMGTRIPGEWFIRRDKALAAVKEKKDGESTGGWLSPEKAKVLVEALEAAECEFDNIARGAIDGVCGYAAESRDEMAKAIAAVKEKL